MDEETQDLLASIRATLVDNHEKLLEAGYYFAADRTKEAIGEIDDLVDRKVWGKDEIPHDYLP